MNRTKKLSSTEVAAFCEQLSLLLPAGITPFEALQLISQDSSSEREKELLGNMILSLQDGSSFYEALSSTGVFPEYMEEMVHLGEESGTLDIVITKLSHYYKQQCVIYESIKSALMYPLIMVVLMLVILVVLLTKILPIFNQVFIQLGSGLKGVSAQLLNIGQILQSVSGIFIVLVTIIAVTILFFTLVPSGKRWCKHFLMTKGFSKDLYLLLSYSRFADALSIVTSAGLDIFKGIELARKLVGNEVLNSAFDICKKSLLEGEYLHEAMKKANIFSASQLRMLQLAHKSGTTDVVFSNISDHYSDKLLKRIRTILSSVEPTLVIIFSLVVGLILLSVIMPLIGIMTELG